MNYELLAAESDAACENVDSGACADAAGGTCYDLSVSADPVKPYIIFLIDRSVSMRDAFPYAPGVDCASADPPCRSRWDSLREVLLGASSGPLMGTGIIERSQSLAYISVVQYTGFGSISSTGTVSLTGSWPDLIEAPAALDNLSAITSTYRPREAGNPPSDGDTPTGESIWGVLCHLDPPYDSGLGCTSLATYTRATGANAIATPAVPLLPADRDPLAPVVFVLATDGEPDSSVDPDPAFDSSGGRTARRFALRATREARMAGIPTYVISLASGASTNAHLHELACEGGTGPAPSEHATSSPYEPVCQNPAPPAKGGAILATNAEAIGAALRAVLTSTIPCSFQLSGTITDVPAVRDTGAVTIDGATVPLDPDNGWYLNDDGRTFVLNGAACSSFRQNPGGSLTATFPCEGGSLGIGP